MCLGDERRCLLHGCAGGMPAMLVGLDWLLGEEGEGRGSRAGACWL